MSIQKNAVSLLWLLPLFLLLGQCKSQPVIPPHNTAVGGSFENADYATIAMPYPLTAVDTSPGWMQAGQKLLVTGTVYELDGKTPAPNVVIYYYHTDLNGKYTHKPDEKRSFPPNEKGQTHGYIRGWAKTDSLGHYAIYTVRPAAYPKWDDPAHIHVTLAEPGVGTYYIDDFVFDDDPRLTGEKRRKLENRGGSGVLRLLAKDNLHLAEHDIVLGLNIPNYPKKVPDLAVSGLQIGEEQPSFTPFHAYGPDQGTKACPVCKYGRYHGLLYMVGNRPNWPQIKQWLTFLEAQSIRRGQYLKVYFVYGNPTGFEQGKRAEELAQMGRTLGLKQVALTFVPSWDDRESEANLNRIDPEAENTFVLYRHRVIVDKWVNLSPTETNFQLLDAAMNRTQGHYFGLEAVGGEH